MRLVINPHDDVSLRRVINVPARGIGKGVMDAVEKIGPVSEIDGALPLLSAGLQPALSANSLWARIVRGLDDRAFAGRAAASLAAFRDLIVKLTDVARREAVSIAIGKLLDQSGYLQDLRDERSEDAEGRVENLAELVSAAREFESREPEPTLKAVMEGVASGCEVVTCIAGADAPLALDAVERCVPEGVELDHHAGGQPAWWWLLCAE